MESVQKQQTLTKTYKGTQQTAYKLFETDALEMQKQGYKPVSENWVRGSHGCGAFLVALLLCVVLIGIIAFIYLLIVPPSDGTLTVKYEYQPVEDTKDCPKCAESVKAQATVCRYCGHQFENQSEALEGKVSDEI